MEDQTKRKRGRPRAFREDARAKTIQSLDRALFVLEELSRGDGVSLSELASRTAQSPTTLYRVLSTFQAHDIVEFDPRAQLWYIGAGAFRVGSTFLSRTDVLTQSRPVMQALMRATGETANLGIERGSNVLFISQVETPETIRAFFPPGTESPMHASGIGKALLAFSTQPPKTNGALERFTEKTITNPDALRADLAATRARGYSVDDEEKALGMRCVAAPIFNAHGEPVAGLSVSGPTFRLTRAKVAETGRLVAEHAARVTRAIGGVTP